VSEELKPCPFCGAKPHVRRNSGLFSVICNDFLCPVRPNMRWLNTLKDAIAAWNTRTTN
jgi:hypothetical protein